MVHRLRALGLVLATVAAIGAGGASQAQAVPTFMAGSYPATLTAEQVEPFAFSSILGVTICNQVIGHGTLGAASSALVLEPSASECTTEGGFIGVTVKTNGCKMQFRVLTLSPEKDFSTGRVDFVCPPGKVIEMTVGPACTIKIGNQEEKISILYEDMTQANPEDITITMTVIEIGYTYSGTVCGTGGFNNGMIEGQLTVKADDVFTNPVALKIE